MNTLETEAQAIARRRSTGMRYLCAFCKADLPGSNKESAQVSHGMCQPVCAPAIALGYGAVPRAVNVVQPDLLFIPAARKHIIENRAIFGSTDIMIEIVSPGTLVIDRYRKPLLYARFGVPEYWIVDPGHDSIEILELKAGKYDLISFAAETGVQRPLRPFAAPRSFWTPSLR